MISIRAANAGDLSSCLQQLLEGGCICWLGAQVSARCVRTQIMTNELFTEIVFTSRFSIASKFIELCCMFGAAIALLHLIGALSSCNAAWLDSYFSLRETISPLCTGVRLVSRASPIGLIILHVLIALAVCAQILSPFYSVWLGSLLNTASRPPPPPPQPIPRSAHGDSQLAPLSIAPITPVSTSLLHSRPELKRDSTATKPATHTANAATAAEMAELAKLSRRRLATLVRAMSRVVGMRLAPSDCHKVSGD